MLVSEEARVFQVRGLRCSEEPTVLGLSPVRLGNRTYRAWRTTKLTPMVRCSTAPDLKLNKSGDGTARLRKHNLHVCI